MNSDASTVTAELRDKIKSKMDVAKFFAGFISLLIGILLKDSEPMQFWPGAGVILLASSLGFCVAAVFAYDRLLMPRKYWDGLTEQDRQENLFQDRLQGRMIQSWTWLFVPAVICFAAGFTLVLLQSVGIVLPELSAEIGNFLLILLLIAAIVLPVWLGFAKGRSQARD